MYVPKSFQVQNEALMFDLMRKFNFALLVTTGDDGLPFATSIPFLIHEKSRTIESHVAKANPQWQHFKMGKEVLVIFQGEHTYVSPHWYKTAPRVPTWNYVTVHAYATAKIIEDETKILTQLNGLVRNHEAHQEKPWDTSGLTPEYMQGMMRGLVAFELNITRLEGKFKLGQNGPLQDMLSAASHLEQSNDQNARTIGRMMREHAEEK